MGVQALQKYIESHVPGAFVPVDLLKIARTLVFKKPEKGKSGPYSNKLLLIVDGECCLDRLYGGYYSDWVCGGQWNRMVQFLAVLTQTIQSNYVELAVYFNGAFEVQRMAEWIALQQEKHKNIIQVLKHVSIKGTPPPKVWWVPPVCLRTSLRMALRHLNVAVYCSMTDHHKEVMNFCLNNNFHGLLAEDIEYAVFNPPRYFSSEQLKLTYKGSLETKEMILEEVSRTIGLELDQLCLLAALLGNHILSEGELKEFHHNLMATVRETTCPGEALIGQIISFVKQCADPSDLQSIGERIFTNPGDVRIHGLTLSVQYYLSGIERGGLHLRGNGQFPRVHAQESQLLSQGIGSLPFSRREEEQGQGDNLPGFYEMMNGFPMATLSGMKAGKSYEISSLPLPASVVLPCISDHNMPSQCDSMAVKIPSVPPEVLRIAVERHHKGLMCPWILQILTQGQIKLPVGFESDKCPDTPNPSLVFRPIRQTVYGILFNLHHLKYVSSKSAGRITVPQIQIKEWVYRKYNVYREPDLVPAELMGWPVPTVQRLWFGNVLEDKKRRLKAFLSCLRADNPLILNTSYVPQHLLVLACVLRFMMTVPKLMIQRQELDAFLIQAMSPHLTEAQYLQELQLEMVAPRGIQLASLFMTGVESALFANDACGAPIPWLMCCPWLFFDGKLFHYQLLRANGAKNLLELCEGKMDVVAKIDRLRFVILDGLKVRGGVNLTPPVYSNLYHPFHPTHLSMDLLPAGVNAYNRRRDYRVGRHPMSARGGQLEIAGVVVGNWGPNINLMSDGRSNMTPQVTAVGGLRGRELVRHLPRGTHNQKKDYRRQNKKSNGKTNLEKDAGEKSIAKKSDAVLTMVTREKRQDDPNALEEKPDPAESESSQGHLEVSRPVTPTTLR